jgi:hypothetical protein
VDLDDAELSELQAKIRKRNFQIATECLNDARQLLADCGLRDVSGTQIVSLGERLIERRIVHASRVISDYELQKRQVQRKALADAGLTNQGTD